MRKLGKLEPARVFYYFEEISKIPRCSHNEQAISDYIVKVGEELGLETIQDDFLNVIIRKPPTLGFENSKGIIIQGHMDMVCEKEDDSDHDFAKDPIQLIIDGDFISADGTTLGADNGIAVAMGLAVMEDTSLEHPGIELLITTSEETKMQGAIGLSDSVLRGSRLINLDSEEEGILTTGSAGGELIEIILPVEYENVQDHQAVTIEVRGLMGGHSGMEIDKPRGNSNKILNTILRELRETIDVKLVSIEGGTKDNAIPRGSMAKLAMKSEDVSKFDDKINEIIKKIKDIYILREPQIDIIITKNALDSKVFKQDIFDSVILLLSNIQTGVNTWLPYDEKTVESSSNLAIIKEEDGNIIIKISNRSLSGSILLELREKIIKETKNAGAEYNISAGYPEWEYAPESKLRDTALALYEKMTNKKMESMVIHAGLECGIFAKKYKGIDLISFGPDMYDVHTPKERLSISSTARVYDYLIGLLKELK